MTNLGNINWNILSVCYVSSNIVQCPHTAIIESGLQTKKVTLFGKNWAGLQVADVFGTGTTHISISTQADVYISSVLNPRALGREVGPVKQT